MFDDDKETENSFDNGTPCVGSPATCLCVTGRLQIHSRDEEIRLESRGSRPLTESVCNDADVIGKHPVPRPTARLTHGPDGTWDGKRASQRWFLSF